MLAPPTCPGCGARESDGRFCDGCRAEVRRIEEPWCEVCGLPRPDGDPRDRCDRCRGGRSFRRARAYARFEGAFPDWVARLKYRAERRIAPALGELAHEAGRRALDLAAYDVVVPVPLHPERLLARGFNQSFLIAEGVAEAVGLPVLHALARVAARPAQVGLDDEARRDNVVGAFALDDADGRDLAGLTVLLVDDVLTTGATADACAEALLRGGAAAVDVLTVARTP